MLKIFTAAAMAACAAGLTAPPDLARADESPATATPIQHLVVVFQENASFDHYFGTYPVAANPAGDPPFTPAGSTPAVNNLLPTTLNGNRDLLATNPNLSRPFRLDRSQFVTCSQDHTYRPEERAANLGRMDRFVQATDNSACALPRPVAAPQVMGYFDGNTVTALWNYAQHFALNDNAFATTYGPSTPGALNLVAGRTSGAAPDNIKNVTQGTVYGDPDPALDDCADAPLKATMSGTNVGDLLSRAGVSWGWFQGGFSRTNPLDQPTATCDASHANLSGVAQPDYEAHHDPFQYFASTANPHHLPPTSIAAIGHDDQANHQYDLTDFWAAAQTGGLPAVSFLKAPAYQDGHPGAGSSDPLDEQDFLVSTLNQLQRLPEWSSTAVVLAWDDSDGQYDHQFPPNVHHSGITALDTLYGTGSDAAPTQLMCMAAPKQAAPDPSSVFPARCGYGERIPLLVVSPFAKENFVDHTLVDQTSVLQFIEDNWGLPRLGQASFDKDAGSLLAMFDFGQRRDDALILNHLTGNPNRPPTVEAPTLAPAAPGTNDTLTVTAHAADLDRDATNGRTDTLQPLRYAWFNGDARLAETGDHLDLSVPGNGDRGDTVTVQVTASDGLDSTVGTSSVVIADSAPRLTLDHSETAGAYSDRVDPVSATTSDPDGDPVTVDATGLPDGVTVMPRADGSWAVGGTVDAPAGRYDAMVRASDGTASTAVPLQLTVQPEIATVGYTGALLFSTGSTTATTARVRLEAHLEQEADGLPGDLSRAGVLFDVYATADTSGPPDASYSAPASAEGDATVDLAALPVGTWTVVVRGDPAAPYFEAPPSDPVLVTVYAPTPGSFVTGGGWVRDPDTGPDHGSFGLEARIRKDGSAAGHLVYVFRGSDAHEYVVRSTSLQSGGLAIDGDHATLAGRCEVTVIDPSGVITGESGNDTFRLDVTDARAGDALTLSVWTPRGILSHRVGTPTEPVPLAGGQIVVHR